MTKKKEGRRSPFKINAISDLLVAFHLVNS